MKVFLNNSIQKTLHSHFHFLKLFSTLSFPTFQRNTRQVLDKIPKQPLNFETNVNDPFTVFIKKRISGLEPDQHDYGKVLSACALWHALVVGVQIYSLVTKNGYLGNGYVVTGLIDLFCKSGRFYDGLRVFEENCGSNVVCWNAIISGGVKNEESLVSLEIFRKMVSRFCMPNGYTFSSVLNACALCAELGFGQAVHGWVIKCDVKDDIFVDTCIVDIYAKCGEMDDAIKGFQRMKVRNVVSWTTVISGFVQKDDANNAIRYFKEMIKSNVEVNKYTLTSVLLACAKSCMVKETMQIHSWALKNTMLFKDSVVKEAFISTYAKFGKFEMSDKIFEDMGLMKSVSTWSAMMSALAQNQNLVRASELFKRVFHEDFKPDEKCASSILSMVKSLDFGGQIHSYVLKVGLVFDVHVASALFTVYSKCGNIEDSYELFTHMNERDRVSWTSMISGFSSYGRAIEAFQLFKEMITEGINPDPTTLSAILMACYHSDFLMKGKEIHAYTLRIGFGNETYVGCGLVSMYLKCKKLVSATRVFIGIQRDQAMWSSLISGYSSNNYNKEALKIFHQMLSFGFELDHILVSSILGVCADLSKPILGKQLHSYGIKKGFMSHLTMSSALVTMYSKCGNINDSHKVFNCIKHPDIVTWTAIIDGYAQHGRGLEALDMFQKMKRDEIKPDSVAFLSILTACNHNGLVEEGFSYFNSMKNEYGIEPEQHHYASIVDLLGRSGRLTEAKDFIDRMPIKPDWLVWSTLLSACTAHSDIALGRIAANKVIELAPRESSAFISASNISAEIGAWDEVERIRSSMKEVGIKKEAGLSFL